MALIILFIFLLLVTFGVFLYFLRPTSMEKAVAEQLGSIEERPSGLAGPSTILKQGTVHSIPIIEDLVSKLPWASASWHLIREAGKDWAVSSLVMMSLLPSIAAFGLVWMITSNLVFSLAAGVVVALSPYVYLYILREVRFARFETLLPEAVDLMSRGLRAGHSIQSVIEMVGKEVADPVGLEFRALHKEQSLGLPIRDAMMNLVNRMPVDDMRFLATAILLQKESGGNLAQILDKTSSVIRERARLRGQIKIYTAQGGITGWILCGAPFLMFGLISITNRHYARVLIEDPTGLKMVYVGIGLMVAGVLTIRKIIDVKV